MCSLVYLLCLQRNVIVIVMSKKILEALNGRTQMKNVLDNGFAVEGTVSRLGLIYHG